MIGVTILVIFILSFSYDIPLYHLYSDWATIHASDIAGLLLILFRLFQNGIHPGWWLPPLRKPLMVYLAVTIVTSIPTVMFVAEDRNLTIALEYSGYWIAKMIEYFAFFYIGYDMLVRFRRPERLLYAVWVGGLFVGSYAVLEYLGYAPHLWGARNNAPGTILSTLSFHHGHHGNYMVLMFMLALGMALWEKRTLLKSALFASLVLFTISELLAARRTAWITLTIALLVWTCARGARFSSRLRRGLMAAGLAAAFLVFISLVPMAAGRAGVFRDAYDEYLEGQTIDPDDLLSLNTRLDIAEFYVNLLHKHPAFLIYGNGYMSSPMRYEYAGAHNPYLDALHDGGVPGLLSTGWVAVAMLCLLWRLYRRCDADMEVHSAMFAATFGFAVVQLTIFLSVEPADGSFSGWFLTLLALLCASAEVQRQRRHYTVSACSERVSRVPAAIASLAARR